MVPSTLTLHAWYRPPLITAGRATPGVTLLEAADDGPVPIAFVAVTVKV
jgi:predicted benzoate:H+ symporter BenE